MKTCFDFLGGPHQKLHYLFRRSGWEANLEYLADEYDLLAFYLGTGFNVGSFEFETNQNIMFYGLSDRIDEYSRAVTFGINAEKPALKLTKWWKDILRQAEQRRFDGWNDVGMFLLNVSQNDQWQFEKSVNRLKSNVRAKHRQKGHENALILLNGPTQRQIAIAAYAFMERTPGKVNVDVQDIIFTGRFDQMSGRVIGVDADGKSYPYSFLKVAAGIH